MSMDFSRNIFGISSFLENQEAPDFSTERHSSARACTEAWSCSQREMFINKATAGSHMWECGGSIGTVDSQNINQIQPREEKLGVCIPYTTAGEKRVQFWGQRGKWMRCRTAEPNACSEQEE